MCCRHLRLERRHVVVCPLCRGRLRKRAAADGVFPLCRGILHADRRGRNVRCVFRRLVCFASGRVCLCALRDRILFDRHRGIHVRRVCYEHLRFQIRSHRVRRMHRWDVRRRRRLLRVQDLRLWPREPRRRVGMHPVLSRDLHGVQSHLRSVFPWHLHALLRLRLLHAVPIHRQLHRHVWRHRLHPVLRGRVRRWIPGYRMHPNGRRLLHPLPGDPHVLLHSRRDVYQRRRVSCVPVLARVLLHPHRLPRVSGQHLQGGQQLRHLLLPVVHRRLQRGILSRPGHPVPGLPVRAVPEPAAERVAGGVGMRVGLWGWI